MRIANAWLPLEIAVIQSWLQLVLGHSSLDGTFRLFKNSLEQESFYERSTSMAKHGHLESLGLYLKATITGSLIAVPLCVVTRGKEF